jgi:hypothetical protein
MPANTSVIRRSNTSYQNAMNLVNVDGQIVVILVRSLVIKFAAIAPSLLRTFRYLAAIRYPRNVGSRQILPSSVAGAKSKSRAHYRVVMRWRWNVERTWRCNDVDKFAVAMCHADTVFAAECVLNARKQKQSLEGD